MKNNAEKRRIIRMILGQSANMALLTRLFIIRWLKNADVALIGGCEFHTDTVYL